MIPSLWTLEPAGNPGAAQPLDALGVVAATHTRTNQGAATLSLTIARGDALTMDLSLWAWESRWVLRRGGTLVFRGRVATPRRSGDAAAEEVTIELRDLWWDLERTTYLQEWDNLTTSGVTSTLIPRALLGRLTTGARETTLASLQRLAAASLTQGAPFSLTASLPTRFAPEIEAANETFAGLIRAVLRRHPSASATIISGESGDSLLVRDRDFAPAFSLPAYGGETVSTEIHPRPDLVVDAVHIHYEAEATHWTEQEADPGETPGIRARRRLAILTDKFPPSSTATRHSLVVDVPTGVSISGGEPPPPPQPHSVAVVTRTIPTEGATDTAAEKFWLDLLGLRSLGLGTDDIRLATNATGGMQPHRVRFAWEVDDPNDPLQGAPSAINPNSTALWRPAAVTDLPRMLVSGSLAEWMRVKAAELVLDATVAVRKSTVDALDDTPKRRFMDMGPTTGEVQGVPAYLLHREFRVMGTNALRKVYRNWPATEASSPAADLAAEIAAAREQHVVPNLAQTMCLERQTLPWEGAVTIARKDVSADQWVGSVLNLTGGETAWTTMRAVIESESHNLVTGRSSIAFGPPTHLAVQDRREMHAVARQSRMARAQAAQTMPPPPREDEDDEELSTGQGVGGVYPSTINPVVTPQHTGGGGGAGALIWALEIVDAEAGSVAVNCGTIIRDVTDLTGELAIAGSESTHTATAGQTLRLKITGAFDDPVCTLEAGAAWTGHPSAVQSSGSGNTAAFVAYYYPLWEFVATAADDTTQIREGLHARRLVASTHLIRTAAAYHKTDDRPFAVPVLQPYHRALS